MSLMSTHALGTKGQDEPSYITASIITGVQGISTHPLGTKGQDGQSYIVVRSPRDVLDIHTSLLD